MGAIPGTLFTRVEHGSFPVSRNGKGVRVQWPQGERSYPNWRRALIAIYNRNPVPGEGSVDPHLTFNRYFRLGRYAPRRPASNLLDLFTPDPENQVTITPPSPEPEIDSSLAVQEEALQEPTLGFDPEEKWLDIRRIFFSGFAKQAIGMGYDPEDVLQDTYVKILAQNAGPKPFNPEKASFGHYIYIMCRHALSNYNRRWSGKRRREQFGTRNLEGEMIDVATSDMATVPAHQEEKVAWREAREGLFEYLEMRAQELGFPVRYVRHCMERYCLDGAYFKTIGEEIGISPGRVSGMVRALREEARTWVYQVA